MDILWWQNVQKYFDHVVDMTPSDRDRYLSLVCHNDDAMLAEINALLDAANEANNHAFLDKQGEFQLLHPGEELNQYTIVKKAGSGAMGEVYLATDKQQEAVAIKCLPILFSQDEKILQRFYHSAKLAMKLQHPGVCKICDIGETNNHVHYLVMEYCDDGDLEQRLPKLKGDTQTAIRYTRELLFALKEAHELAIWHRDIKPSNIMFTNEDQLKIVDFGIAKDADTKLTVTGTRLGTPAYMAPEQWTGTEIDHRADLWAIGVILYEMIAGVRPFKGDTLSDIMNAIYNSKPIPLSRICPNIPNELDVIISKSLNKDKSLRYQNAEELLSTLKAI